jgi:glycerate kinase
VCADLVRVVLAPQSFKGSLDAPDVARALARGVRQVFPEADLDLLPVADGGEGTVQALVQASGGRTVTTRVMGPLGGAVNATWGLLGDGDTAVVEMAAASGLPLIPRSARDPRRTTTFGTGELIRHALDHGIRRLIVGLGGSATNDGGAGMAQALGVRLLDAQGEEIPRGGAALARLDHIDMTGLDPRVRDVQVEAAVDVNNPLCGPEGASHVYGPQKGADGAMARELDAALENYAGVIRRDLGDDVRDVPGAGAAGGMGAGLLAFLHARIAPGVDIVFRALHVEERIRRSSLVLTGEGRMDSQDIYGKAPMAVAAVAHRFGVPVIAVVGSTSRDYRVVFDHGLDAVIGVVNRPMSQDRAISETAGLVAEAAMRAMRIVRVGMRIGQDNRSDFT